MFKLQHKNSYKVNTLYKRFKMVLVIMKIKFNNKINKIQIQKKMLFIKVLELYLKIILLSMTPNLTIKIKQII